MSIQSGRSRSVKNIGDDSAIKGGPKMAEALLTVASVGADSEWTEAPMMIKLYLDALQPRGASASLNLVPGSLLDGAVDPIRSDLDFLSYGRDSSELRTLAGHIAQAVPKSAIGVTLDDLIKRSARPDSFDSDARGWSVISAAAQSLAARRELANLTDTFEALVKGIPTCTKLSNIARLNTKSRMRCDALHAWLKTPRTTEMAGAVADKLTNNLEIWPSGIGPALRPLFVNLDAATSSRVAMTLWRAIEKPSPSDSADRVATYYDALESVLPNVTQQTAIELGRRVLIRVKQSSDPASILRLCAVATAFASRLPPNGETRSMLLELMKFPGARMQPLIDALRTDIPEIPGYGASPLVFLHTLSRNPALGGVDLNAPAPR